MNWRLIHICQLCRGAGCSNCDQRGIDQSYKMKAVFSCLFVLGTAVTTCAFLLMAIKP